MDFTNQAYEKNNKNIENIINSLSENCEIKYNYS